MFYTFCLHSTYRSRPPAVNLLYHCQVCAVTTKTLIFESWFAVSPQTLYKLFCVAIGRLAGTTGCLCTLHLGCSPVYPKCDGRSVTDSAFSAGPHRCCLGHSPFAVGWNYRSDLDAYISRPGECKHWHACMLALDLTRCS